MDESKESGERDRAHDPNEGEVPDGARRDAKEPNPPKEPANGKPEQGERAAGEGAENEGVEGGTEPRRRPRKVGSKSAGPASKSKAGKEEPAVETDPRFPTGRWKGFWLQRQYAGRQWMDLNLTFRDGLVSGIGRDRIGAFTLAGSYDLKSGRCDLIKQYVNQHAVEYRGFNEQHLWLWGTWHLPGDRGGFHVWPAGEDDPTAPHLQAEEKLPVPQVIPV